MDSLKVMRLGTGDVIGFNRDECNRFNSMSTASGFHMEFVNYTNRVLKVKNRMGVIRSIMPNISNSINNMNSGYDYRPGIGIKISVEIAACDIPMTLRSLKKSAHLSKLSDALHSQLIDGYRDLQEKRKSPNHRISDYSSVPLEVYLVIHSEDLKDKFKYYTELDVSLTLVDEYQDIAEIPHPNVPEELVHVGKEGVDFYHDVIKESVGTPLGFTLKFIDNTGHHTLADKYIYLFGEVYKVPIVRNSNDSRHGLVVERTHGPVRRTLENFHANEGFFTVEEAFKYAAISNTVENAPYAGDRKLRHEREITELRMQTELTKEKVVVRKHQLDLRTMAVKMLEESSKIKERKKKSKPTAAGYLNFMSDMIKAVSTTTKLMTMLSTS